MQYLKYYPLRDKMKKTNIFTNIPQTLKEELFEDILNKPNIKIQRIVSDGHITEEFDWYDQDSDEWVIVLQGAAIIKFKNENDVKLEVGDYINIPAHKKHKVTWSSKEIKTIWLAIHY